MDKHIIKMPDIGEGIAEVEIVEWHVDVGDTVAEDQVLADVMTDKASVEIPAPIAGIVVSLGGQVGDVLAVGSELITLQPQVTEADTGIQQTAAQTQDTAKALADAGHPAPQAHPAPEPAKGIGNGQHTDGNRDHRIESRGGPDNEPRPESRSTVLASPSVRQRARHLDIDLRELTRGQDDTPVSHRDLDDFLMSRHAPDPDAASQRLATQSEARAKAAGGSTGSALSTNDDTSAAVRGDTQIKVMGLRRQIALKMQESKRQIPHFSYVEEVDVTELEKLRAALNAQQGDDHDRLTLLPFLVRALVLAVQRFPQINAHYDSENALITQFGSVHMGVATQSENGLLVPVLRHAESRDIWDCAAEIRRLSALARRGKAQRNDLTGSTLTISSLGALGGIAATPIINHPEVAIVGVNRIVEKPMLDNGQLVLRKTMNLSSSFDHRIVDGMHAAQFIQEVRRLLEAPALLFVHGPA